MPTNPTPVESLWKELGDMMMECQDERSRVEWLASAFERPEHEILEALQYGEKIGEVRSDPKGYWRII